MRIQQLNTKVATGKLSRTCPLKLASGYGDCLSHTKPFYNFKLFNARPSPNCRYRNKFEMLIHPTPLRKHLYCKTKVCLFCCPSFGTCCHCLLFTSQCWVNQSSPDHNVLGLREPLRLGLKFAQLLDEIVLHECFNCCFRLVGFWNSPETSIANFQKEFKHKWMNDNVSYCLVLILSDAKAIWGACD
jgi:hypothetical protein